MAHEPSESLSRDEVREEYPWAFEEKQKMVIGSDIDAILSSVLMHEYLDWEPIGFYNFENIYRFSKVSEDELKDAVWVDLDIYDPDIRSIGHHILRFRLNDNLNGHRNSLNPNILPGMYHGNFSHKYPLRTLHFLSWLHEVPNKLNREQKLLFWLPDSTWINGQSHRFRENVRDWLFNCVELEFMIDTFDDIEDERFEKGMKGLFSQIKETGFDRGRGQVTSKNLNIGGHQCAFDDPLARRTTLKKLIDKLGNIMNWDAYTLPDEMEMTQGQRTSNYLYSNVLEEYEGIDEFLEDKNVFSYAIPNRGRLNYTTNIRI